MQEVHTDRRKYNELLLFLKRVHGFTNLSDNFVGHFVGQFCRQKCPTKIFRQAYICRQVFNQNFRQKSLSDKMFNRSCRHNVQQSINLSDMIFVGTFCRQKCRQKTDFCRQNVRQSSFLSTKYCFVGHSNVRQQSVLLLSVKIWQKAGKEHISVDKKLLC